MPNEIENENSLNLGIEDISEIDDLDVLKEKYNAIAPKAKDAVEKNRQLFERAKKAEGELKELKAKAEEKPKAPKQSDDKLLERLDKMALQVAGINEADEVEHFNKWKTETGREADAIVGNSIFKKELEDMRTAKANLKATSDIKGEQGESGVRNTPDYWIAKATKGADGKLMFPEEMPKELYTKVLDKLQEGEPSSSNELKFYDKK